MFKSIEELPIWNFNKVIEKNDLRYLLKLDDYYKLPELKDDLNNIWETIIDEFYNEFGISEKYRNTLLQEKDMAMMELEYALGNKSLKTIIEIKKRNKKTDNDDKFEEQVARLEIHFKIPIDVRKMSVQRYYTYIKLYGEN